MASSSSSASKTPAKTNVDVNPGPPPSSAGGTTIPLNPVNPLPVGYNFSQTTEHNCLVCQDYTIIDQFAKDCRLQKLWTIHSAGVVSAGTPESRGNNPSNLTFDATELLHAFGKLSEEYHLAKADQNALQNQVQRVGNDVAQDDAAGKTIKLHLVEIQAAYAPLADNVNKYNDAVKAVDDQIKPLDGEVSSLKHEQFAAVNALASQSSKTTGDVTKKLQAAINVKLEPKQEQLNALNTDRDAKKKLYDDAVAKAAPFIKPRNEQVDYMALALFTKFVAVAGIDPRDHVARARLFFSWVAYSIRYDMDLKAKNAEGIEKKTRPTADTVTTGIEICGGYTELFRQMFNTTDLRGITPIMYQGQYIGGKTKKGTKKQDEPKRGHAWSAFALSDDDEPTMKVIDPCWAAGSDPDATAGQFPSNNNAAVAAEPSIYPLYFTMSNKEFLRDHFPNNPYQQYVDPQISKEAFWSGDAAMFGDPAKTQFIERSTIEPAPFTIKATSVGVVNFSFAGSCPHVFEKQLIKPLFLTIGVETDAPDVNKMIPFVYDAASQRWRAQLDLTGFQAKGYYLISIRAAYQNGVQLPCHTAAELKAIQGPVLCYPIVWWKYGDMPTSALDQWFAKWERFTSDQFNS